MKISIVDTNVAIVAEGGSPQAGSECVGASIDMLIKIMKSGGLALDRQGLILSEYVGSLGFSGQPGIGRAFARWAFNNQFIDGTCLLYEINRLAGDGWRRFREVPDDENLSSFDPSDQKFVAVAVAAGRHHTIYNSTDSDWVHHNDVLIGHGVRVTYLCPKECSP